jgi:hypothetical protein
LALVLAIEPDARQAAAVSRVVKDRVGAELVLVDSKDRAIAAINARVPDLILIPALFSPRDEEDLVTHLRSLQGAEHLQTLTIPLLASSRREDRPKRGGGLFGRRKDGVDSAPDGCDPGVFAEQIAGYLKNATEVKAAREAAAAYSARFEEPAPAAEPQSAAAPAADWLAPEAPSDLVFEPLHPLESAMAAAPPVQAAVPSAPQIEPAAAEYADHADQAQPPVEATASAPSTDQAESPVAAPEHADHAIHAADYADHAIHAADYADHAEGGAPPSAPVKRPLVGFATATLGELLARERELLSAERLDPVEPPTTGSPSARRLPPLAMWARVPAQAGQSRPAAPDASRPFDVAELLNMLRVPVPVATISYARGCRVRRVCVAPEVAAAETASRPHATKSARA